MHAPRAWQHPQNARGSGLTEFPAAAAAAAADPDPAAAAAAAAPPACPSTKSCIIDGPKLSPRPGQGDFSEHISLSWALPSWKADPCKEGAWGSEQKAGSYTNKCKLLLLLSSFYIPVNF